MRHFGPLIFLAVSWLPGACRMDEDRFEQISKLRSIGVSAMPVISKLSTSPDNQSVTTLTIYSAVPLGQEVTVASYTDKPGVGLPQLPLEIVTGSEKYVDYAAFRLFSVNAKVVLPQASLIPIPPKPGFTRLKYGVLLRSGSEEEKIVGNLIVYPEGASELTWQNPSAEIAAPTSDQVLDPVIDLKANLISPNPGESLRVGWYVSSGKVQNRRAKETQWEGSSSGVQTIMITVRGLKSGAFATPNIIDVKIP